MGFVMAIFQSNVITTRLLFQTITIQTFLIACCAFTLFTSKLSGVLTFLTSFINKLVSRAKMKMIQIAKLNLADVEDKEDIEDFLTVNNFNFLKMLGCLRNNDWRTALSMRHHKVVIFSFSMWKKCLLVHLQVQNKK